MARALICLDENVALDFLSGQLAPPELAEAEHHLAGCESCVELLARSAPFLTVQPGPATPKAPRRELSPTLSTLAMKPAQNDAGAPRIIKPDDAPTDGADDLELEEPPTLEEGTVLKDTYKVVGLVGRGGMGEVYEVTHARLAGRYALKLLPPAFALEHVSVTRFRREADITSALRHPNIVQVVDFNHTPAGQPFLVMEFLDGGDLAQLMSATGAMPLERALPIVEQIVSALSAVHRRGIVHRDLKPQNVLLVRGDDLLAKDRVKLVDFGLSKRNESSMLGVGVNISRERTLLGTPRYMAPEQAAGKIDEIDAKTDQFALGAIVYEMLTGVTAFNGDNMAVLLYRIVAEDPLPMRQFVPTIPEYIERAVARAMAKQKEDRFPSTHDFLVALAGGDLSTRIPSGLDHEAVGARVVTPRASTAISSSGTAATMAAGERLPRSVEVPPPQRSRVAAFVVGLGAALGLALAVQAFRARNLPPQPPLPTHAADTVAPPRPPAALPVPPPPPSPPVQEASPPPPAPEATVVPPPAKPLAGVGREATDKPVGNRGRKVLPPKTKPRPQPEVLAGPPPSATPGEKPAGEKSAGEKSAGEKSPSKDLGILFENL